MRDLMRTMFVVLAGLTLTTGAQAASVVSVAVSGSNSDGEWGDGNFDDPDCGGFSPFGCEGPNWEDDSSVSVPNGWNEWRNDGNSVGTIGGGGTTFTSNHDYYVATQAQNAITTALYYNGRVDYTISVNALAPEEWDLTINVANIGTVTHTDEDAGFIEISSSTSSATVFALNRTAESGSVAFGLPNTYGSNVVFNDNGGSYNQAGSFVVSGQGAQTFSFAITFEINTDIAGEVSFGSGDSLCFNGGLAAVGDGPNTNCGVGGGTGLNLDGSITTTFVPEPATALMVGLGLLGLGAIGRRRD